MPVYQVTAERNDVWSILVSADSPYDAMQKVNANDFESNDAAYVDQGEWIARASVLVEE